MSIDAKRSFNVRLLAMSGIFTLLFSYAASAVGGNPQPLNPDLVIENFIHKNEGKIQESGQLIFAINQEPSLSRVMIHAVEKNNTGWKLVFVPFDGSIGKKGFAPFQKKLEGDGKSPSGIFPLGTAFGYAPLITTKMPYRQASDDDFWVDDPNSQDYNKWIKGKPNAASWERMKRDDDHYKYGIVIEYNMHPVVKGKGSAIFLHVWNRGGATLGCVSVSEDMMIRLLGWLDPAKNPLIVMGTESQLLRQ
jgi:L,D-peptidoglycan transpeptidase YkuD (ErfK/YbiS/YcfS/YnhG family)